MVEFFHFHGCSSCYPDWFVICCHHLWCRKQPGIVKDSHLPHPTVIYFASVLFLAAILIIPVHSRLSAALCTSVFGVLRLFYTVSLLVRQGIRKNYYEILDLIPYAGLPLLGYGILE